MKLLTPKQVQNASNEALAHAIRKEHEATKALKALEAKIQNTKQSLVEAEEQKRAELSAIDLRIKTRLLEEGNIIASLEERRKAAVQPIIDEIAELEARREEVQRMHDDVVARQSEVHDAMQKLRALDREIQVKQKALERFRDELDKSSEGETIRITALREEIYTRLKHIEAEDIRIDSKVQYLREREEDARRAEEKVKAAMLVADDKLYRIKKGEESIESNRRMLALAVKQFKKRGLWDKVQDKMQDYD